MRVLLVAGARPNFMKVAPVLRALRRADHQAVLVHTDQHHDARMSAAFFRDLEIPEPDFHLGAGSGSHAVQTARVMEAFEPVLLGCRPQWVVVVGDVNSTLGCALVTAKLRVEIGARIAHVEAGLRSADWRMPEEVNRVLTDRLSDVLLTPSRDARANLIREGIEPERIHFAGNVMVDTLLAYWPKALQACVPEAHGLERGRYVVATLHRPSNVDDPEALEVILRALERIALEMPVVLPLHPRTRLRIREFGLEGRIGRLHLMEPLGYTEMLGLTDAAAVVLTDSGGLQEETTVLGVPCVTLREQTERPITVTEGTNRLAPWPLSVEGVFASFRYASSIGRSAPGTRSPEGWDGHAASRIVRTLESKTPADDFADTGGGPRWSGPPADRVGVPLPIAG